MDEIVILRIIIESTYLLSNSNIAYICCVKKYKILYISYDGMTDPLGQSQVLPYLIGLSKQGYSFDLISFEKQELFNKNNTIIAKICQENNIEWHPLFYTKKPPLLSTLYDVFRMNQLAKKLHAKKNFTIIHCRSYISALIGAGFKKKYGTKFLFDMRGFWADERTEGRIWNLKNPIFKTVYSFFKRKELHFFKEADHTVSLTFNGKEEIESWEIFKHVKPAITVIPCCVDLDLFSVPTSTNESLKKKLGISPESFVLGYVGSIGTWYMLPEMLQYFKVFVQKNPTACFLFVTNEKPDYIRTIAIENGIDPTYIIVQSCLHKEVPDYISIFDASIFFIRPTYSKKASSPTKQGEIMAMGKPLICNSGVGDTDMIVKKYQAGTVIEQFDEKTYAENCTFKNFNAEKTIEGANDYFGLDLGIDRYSKIYHALVNR